MTEMLPPTLVSIRALPIERSAVAAAAVACWCRSCRWFLLLAVVDDL